jgi:hypothetical protein
MLSIHEYSDVGSTQRGSVAIPLEPPHAAQSIEVGPASVQSKPMADSTCLVRLTASVDCAFEIGDNPDATDSFRRLVAGEEKIIAVVPGAKMKIAAIANGNGVAASGMNSLEGLLKLITSPDDVAKQLNALLQAAARLEAATQAHTEAVKASAWSGKLAEWEDRLNQRERAAAAVEADLAARFVAIQAVISS